MLPTPRKFAHTPTFAEVMDCLGEVFGLVMNREHALSNKGAFANRIEAYSGGKNCQGLEDRLLDLLEIKSESLRLSFTDALHLAETVLTEAQSYPLITQSTSEEGTRTFIRLWGVPWIGTVLKEASYEKNTVLYYVWFLFRFSSKNLDGDGLLKAWKKFIKESLPKEIRAPEFLATINRIDNRSQRKLFQIKNDIDLLRDEFFEFKTKDQTTDDFLKNTRLIYIAGMASIRLEAMLRNKSSSLVDLLVEEVQSIRQFRLNDDPWTWWLGVKLTESSQMELGIGRRIDSLWHSLGSVSVPEIIYRLTSPEEHLWDLELFESMLSTARAMEPVKLLKPLLSSAEGQWHFGHGRHQLAKQCFEDVLFSATERQLGTTAAMAAMLLIGLRVDDTPSATFQDLHSLVGVYVDSMHQNLDIQLTSIPSPFNDWDKRPEVNAHDSHVMASLRFFNEFPRAPGVHFTSSAFARFEKGFMKIMLKAQIVGTTLNVVERNRIAISGTSIKTYDCVRNLLFYWSEVCGNTLPLPRSFQAYLGMPKCDQLRLLRYIHPERFSEEAKLHGMADWSHPDDR